MAAASVKLGLTHNDNNAGGFVSSTIAITITVSYIFVVDIEALSCLIFSVSNVVIQKTSNYSQIVQI